MKRKPVNPDHHKKLAILGSLCREHRFNYGLSQEELSNNTNIHRRTIQRLEQGKNVTLLSVIEIAEAFEIDLIKELIGD